MTAPLVATRQHDTGLGAAPKKPEWRRGEAFLYIVVAALTSLLLIPVLHLWRARLSTPLSYSGDALAVGAHFKTILEQGWYEFTPNLGAPAGQNYHDFPTADNLHFAVARLLVTGTDSFAVAMNLYYLAGFPLIAVAAAWFLRLVGVSRVFSAVLAILYAFAPYHLLRGEDHLFLSSYFVVPLASGIVVSLARGRQVWGPRPSATIEGSYLRRWVTSRNALVLVAIVLIGSASIYYAVFTLFFLVVAAAIALATGRGSRTLVEAIGTGVALVGVMIANVAPDLLYMRDNGVNLEALQRSLPETEVYALKLSSLLLPSPTHRLAALRELRQQYDSRWPLPSEAPTLGAVAAIGLVVLLGVILVVAARQSRPTNPVAVIGRRTSQDAQPHDKWQQMLPVLGVLAVSGLLLATVGGLSTIVTLLVTDSIRGWNRISIFLALFALGAVGLLLDAFFDRLSRISWARSLGSSVLPVTCACAVLVIGLADQTSPLDLDDYTRIGQEFDSDRGYVAALEARLPSDAMIFQLPYRPFPESSPVHRIVDYDELRPYLHSSSLRWSYGGIKGRPEADWPRTLADQPTDRMLHLLAVAGFEGIHVDRYGYPDAGQALEAEVRRVAQVDPVVSENQRYSFWHIGPLRASVESAVEEDDLADLGQAIIRPVAAYLDASFDDARFQDDAWFSYSRESASVIHVDNPRNTVVNVTLSFSLTVSQAMQVAQTENLADVASVTATVVYPSGVERSVVLTSRPTLVEQRLEAPPGRSLIKVHTPADAGGVGAAQLQVTDAVVQNWQLP